MSTILDTFITKFRFESDNSGLKKIESDLDSFKSKVLKIGASIFALISGGELISHTAESIDSMLKFSDSVGISVNQLQELQFAAQRTGVPVDALKSSIENLTVRVGEASRGYGTSAEIMGRFGVSIRNANGGVKNSYQILVELNRTFQHLSTAQQFDLAQNLGINAQTIKLLQQTPEEFDKLILKSKQLGEFSRLNAIQAAKFEDALTDLKTSFFNLSVQLGSILFPILTKFADILSMIGGYLNRHSGWVKALATSVGILSASFVVLRSRAVLAWAATFAPISAIIAAVTALVFVIQDIWVGFKGGKSVIFDFIKNSKTIQHIWRDIKSSISFIVNELNKVLSFFSNRLPKTNFKHLPENSNIGAKNVGKILGQFQPSILKNQTPIMSNSTHKNVVSNQQLTMNVGGITVNSTSQNPEKLGNEILEQIKNNYKTSVNFFDSDIAR